MPSFVKECFRGEKLESFYLIIGLIVALGMVLYFLLERRWVRAVEEMKTNQASHPMWSLLQQQMDQLQGQLNDGLTRNISSSPNNSK